MGLIVRLHATLASRFSSVLSVSSEVWTSEFTDKTDGPSRRPRTRKQERRRAARVSRLLALLRVPGILRKVTGTHRYHLTPKGRTVVTALLTAREADTEKLTQLAA